MFSEDDLLPISALAQLAYCQRRAALIHLEGLWAENRFTVEGRHLHEKAHDGPDQTRGGVRVARGLPLRSLRLGLAGKADVVEFHPVAQLSELCPRAATTQRVVPPESARPFPVEYKRGKPKANDCDRIQLCAQALCLEEMLGVPVPAGALFYGRTRRRQEVEFTPELRRAVEDAAARLHQLIAAGRTPPAQRSPRCKRCSLIDLCLPAAAAASRSASRYLASHLYTPAPAAPAEDSDP